MLGSNQRPLPCESEACWFAVVRRCPISAFLSPITRCLGRRRSLSSAPVVVKLSSDHRLPGTPHYSDSGYSRTAAGVGERFSVAIEVHTTGYSKTGTVRYRSLPL